MSPVLKKVQSHAVVGNKKFQKMQTTLNNTQGQLSQIKAFRVMSAESGKNAQAQNEYIQRLRANEPPSRWLRNISRSH